MGPCSSKSEKKKDEANQPDAKTKTDSNPP